MKVVTVLDFIWGEVHIYHYDEMELHNQYNDDIDEFIRAKGHTHSDYHYLCTDELKLQVHAFEKSENISPMQKEIAGPLKEVFGTEPVKPFVNSENET